MMAKFFSHLPVQISWWNELSNKRIKRQSYYKTCFYQGHLLVFHLFHEIYLLENVSFGSQYYHGKYFSIIKDTIEKDSKNNSFPNHFNEQFAN